MSKYAVVVIAYNRVNSIRRLLNSLSKANYEGDKVDLIISIDKSDTNDVVDYAEKFNWEHGKKKVKIHEKRLGLKKHVLNCGNYLNYYEAIAVLEDDTYVSPAFYTYMKQSVEFFHGDNNIAGISLYSHMWSIQNNRPFIPEKNKWDVYFLQYAQSWGQIWMKNQWFDFMKWYEQNNLPIEKNSNIPNNVTDWPETSWLKYHIKYCIDNNKYFVYPYTPLSTNFTDIGQHNLISSSTYQVPIMYDENYTYNFLELDDKKSIVYDAFFEREQLGTLIGVNNSELNVNLYGKKGAKSNKKYLITMENLNNKIINKYSLVLKPHEMNIILNIPGDDIFLYDTSISVSNPYKKDTEMIKWYYDVRNKDYKKMVNFILLKIKQKIKNKINKFYSILK